jgi:Ca2+-binding RTX toxin-like protein
MAKTKYMPWVAATRWKAEPATMRCTAGRVTTSFWTATAARSFTEGRAKTIWSEKREMTSSTGAPATTNKLKGDSGEDVLYGWHGNDILYALDGQRDELYCGEGRDEYVADKIDYVDSSCEIAVKVPPAVPGAVGLGVSGGDDVLGPNE